MPETILEVKNLNVSFGDLQAVNNISFSLKPGEVLGILGTNGAGKTTTLKSLAGIINPTSGIIKINGIANDTLSNKEIIKQRVGYCPDVGGLIQGATPKEHIDLLLTLHRKPELSKIAYDLLDFMGLKEFVNSNTGGFSHGMSRRLSVMLACLAAEDVLILDEPFDGVDPVGVDAINELIAEARDAGLGIIVSTHLLKLLLNVSDRVAVINHGTIIHESAPEYFRGIVGEIRYKKLLEG